MQRSTVVLGALLVLGALGRTAEAQFERRFTATTAGKITFTGNSLGLDKRGNDDAPGTNGSIGTFITTNTALRDNSSWPFGTTEDWRQNRSEADLQLPAGATVLYAELVWGGSYAEDSGQENVRTSLNNPVQLTTPAGTTPVSPDAAFQPPGPPGSLQSGSCNPAGSCFYARSADVTALVQAGGAGRYGVGGVPGTQASGEENFNAAGWTLAVVYEDFSEPIRNLTLFRGFERSGAPPASVSGFCTPPGFAPLSGRLAVSALEGDVRFSGDEMRFGERAPLSAANRVFGPRNLAGNFFAGQITDDDGNIDTTGTFGTRNHNPTTAVSGARQSWDIANVDVSSQLENGQTFAVAQGTTDQDVFTITALGLQIDIGAPRFRADAKTVTPAAGRVGDLLTYTVVLANTGTAAATDVVFKDPPPPGTSFVAGSFSLDGTPSGANPGLPAGVPIPGGVTAGATRTVRFQVRVDTIPPAAEYVNTARWTFNYVSCQGQPSRTGAMVADPVTTPIARIEATKAVEPASLETNETAIFTVTIRNTGTARSAGVTLTDPIPAGLTYVPGTTRLNSVPVPDAAGGTMPFAAGRPVNSLGLAAGQIDPNTTAVVSFQVTAAPNTAGTVTNTATIEPDGAPGGLPPFPVTAPVNVTPIADLAIVKTGPATTTPGSNVTYTLTVTNNGPSNVAGATVTDQTPAGLTFVSNSCTPATFPCSLGPLAAGASQTITTTFSVPPDFGQADPIVNGARVSVPTPPTIDPNLGNNTSTAQTAINAPVMDLGVTKTNGVLVAVPGASLTPYTIMVTNAGPSLANGAQVVDVFPSDLTDVTWTCVASAGSSCPVSGTGTINTAVIVQPGGTLTFTVNATIASAATGTLVNTVSVTAPAGGSDPDGTNNEASDIDLLRPEADLAITKTGPTTLVPGTEATYQVTVTNNGPSDAVEVRAFDPEQPGRRIMLRSMDCPTASEGVCELGTVPAGATRTINVTFDVPVDLAVPGEVTNVAFVEAGTFDPVAGNNSDDHTATVTAIADLEITKSAPETVTAGTTFDYRITVTNAGPSIAQNVQVTDPTPPGLTFVRNTEGCTTPFPCSLGALQPNESRTIVATFAVPPDYAGPDPVVNTATVSTTATDPNLANNSATDSSALIRVADIAVEKQVVPTAVLVGGSVTYTITASNRGPSDATGVVVSEVLPAGTTLTGATPSAGSYAASTGTWTVGNLPVRTTATLTITATVNVAGQLSNTATKTGGNEFDPDTGNDSAAAVLNAAVVADVGIDIAVNNENPVVGEFVSFTVTVVNRGPSPATGVVTNAGIITGIQFISAETTQGTYDPATLAWFVGDLAVGQTVVLQGVVQVLQAGTLLNEGFQTHIEFDPNPPNDRDAVVLNAGEVADLQVTKTASNEMPQVGEQVAFTVTVRNNGPSAATGVLVQDPVPPGLTFVSAIPSQGTYDAATGQWAVGTLGVNESETLALTVEVTSPGTFVNTAVRGGAEQPDPNPNNDVGTATLRVPPAPAADLSIVKTAAPATVAVGEQITWTLTVANAGPETAPGVIVTDIVPPQVSLVSATPSQGTCSPMAGQLICTLGDLPAGASATVTIVATRTAPDAFLNTATVSGGVLDPNTSNNTSTAQTGPAGEDDCGNCIDDDGDGLVDAEDPDCCADPQTLTITATHQLRARLQVKGRLPAGAFAGIDPRQADVQLVLRDAQGAVACCAVPPEQWRKVLGRVYWFRDRQNECPPLKSLCLIVPKRGPTRTVVNTSPQTPSPLDITLSTGNQCVRGQSSSRPRARGKAVSR